jgi:hypothetical protein
MVLKRKIDHGFTGFKIADIPRGPRSIRRRGPYKKSIDSSDICAFELLASLAGKLLQESESSTSSNVSEGHDQPVLIKDGIKLESEDDKAIKADRGGYEVSAVSEAGSQNVDQKCFLKEFPHLESDAVLEHASTISIVNFPEKFSGDIKSEKFLKNNASGDFPDRADGGYPEIGESSDGNSENDFGQHEQVAAGGLIEQCSRKDPLELSLKFPALINSSSDIKSPSSRVPVLDAFFARHKNYSKLGSRDDDEKLSRCNKLNNKFKDKFKAYRLTRIGDRRIRKLLTFKYWKVAPTLKDYEFSKADGRKKPLYRKRKTCYSHERFRRDSLYKRKKYFDQNSVASSDGAFSSESVSNSPLKGSTSANGVSRSVTGHQAPFNLKDSYVKFSIKSFRIPELFVEVPETNCWFTEEDSDGGSDCYTW